MVVVILLPDTKIEPNDINLIYPEFNEEDIKICDVDNNVKYVSDLLIKYYTKHFFVLFLHQ